MSGSFFNSTVKRRYLIAAACFFFLFFLIENHKNREESDAMIPIIDPNSRYKQGKTVLLICVCCTIS